MGIINYSEQIVFAGSGYLDAKMMPVEKVSDLKKILRTQRFEGLTVTVLKDEQGNSNPQDYWLIGGTSDNHWVPKTMSGYNDLKLVLEDGILNLMNGDEILGDGINLNDFFPTQPGEFKDLYISSIEYTITNDNGDKGIFLCFTYSDETKKYLDMSQFLSQTYEPGSGIVINGNVISLDDAILGRIQTLENNVLDNTKRISEIQERLKEINNLSNQINQNTEKIENTNIRIGVLEDKVNSLTSDIEGSVPDGKTIGLNEENALCVKVLEKEGNLLKVDEHNGNNGLYVSIPVFYEDEELLKS